MKRCERCLLPCTYPGISFDAKNECNFCQDSDHKKTREGDSAPARHEGLAAFEALIERIRDRGEDYDCMVFYSGGKDSTYLLLQLKEKYNLRVLAFTSDNEFMSPIARKNIQQTLAAIDVDHVWGRPAAALLRGVIAGRLLYASKHGKPAVSTVCERCFSITLMAGIKVAMERKIPMVAVGLSPAQMNFSTKYQLPDQELTYMLQMIHERPLGMLGYVPKEGEMDAFYMDNWQERARPAVLYPYAVMDYDISENNKLIFDRQLINPGNEHPLKSNCQVNLLLLKLDTLRFGYGPYDFEFSHSIRNGQYDRDEWRPLYEKVVDEMQNDTFEKDAIDSVLATLGLTYANLSLQANEVD